MTAKEYLMQARTLDARIDSKCEQVARLRAKVEAGRSSSPTGMPRGGSGTDWTDTVAKVIALENEINADIDELVALKREIIGVIAAVPDARHRTLLEMRYLAVKSWKEIADMMHYGRTRMWQLHNEALRNLQISERWNTSEHSNVVS